MSRSTSRLHNLLRAIPPLRRVYDRVLLSRAKHPSLAGHPRMALRLARQLPFYSYGEDQFLRVDDAPAEVVARRRRGLERLKQTLEPSPETKATCEALAAGLADLEFTTAYRVPFQFRELARKYLPLGCLADACDGPRLRDPDGRWFYDLGGSYGVNLFGIDFYRRCITTGVATAEALGPVLGIYHPAVADNVARLRVLSQQDQVSFHMSGTEAVMQAVRLARYHTGRAKLVRFCGAYHGWWDGVQAGVGNPRPVADVLTLREQHALTLEVLRTRDDIACVLVNPLQALHPNKAPASDGALVTGERTATYDRDAYTRWLHQLREVCSARNIVLIFDEVFLGFRLAPGGAQAYFGVHADLVTYGKSLGGGLPVGVLCGRADLMRRFRDDRPADLCFARGTFNSHPYVMATMQAFLHHLDDPSVRASYDDLDTRWNTRAEQLNRQLRANNLPVHVVAMTSVWTTLFRYPGRYHWLLQYYLRAAGIFLGWTGTARLIFSHNLADSDFAEICDRFVAAATAMHADGWWWQPPVHGHRKLKRRIASELLRARFTAA